MTNGVAEALNGIIQTVKRKCRGFRMVGYFAAIIDLVAPHRKFDLPDPVRVQKIVISRYQFQRSPALTRE